MSVVTPKAIVDSTEYHLGELENALDPSRPEHILPAVETARVGVVDVGCGLGQLFVGRSQQYNPVSRVALPSADIPRALPEAARGITRV